MKLLTMLTCFFCLVFSVASAYADDDEFKPAYQNVDSYDVDDSNKFFVRYQGRDYYTSGREDGFRVNENNEESTDETVGILTFLIAPFSILYMNLIGWWE
ncbi:hypothetical protein A3742_03880 [Oleiphilus sp. HI0071]|jgi:uncharacterized protein YneR|uniref:hypothetical protein n=1 Tax=unclassified Oleiphilus TaxID=2631174 RepID=UPI0007C25A62|nr:MULTISPECIES: hypothetical protein [unclassified Oleiphilus]KZY63477.1 hypothetical protein A3737_18595 [Oleiphilus sp. HI0065]KZY85103.1 hypothetical protein A3742_30010 [Oleiphilus sp. HI0071]KZY89246.1 hypothetical protein A3744_06765 [Oleiphilus sp. HI0073]KZZ46858.1 hypothetical protein A3758_35875 [Oleiphilus sp. HI0118]KZZ49264.1 hypothetical protein A3760_22035 [Oleiphilus sp. HI0122]KZZ66759.1 hypothetical protein A3765_19210 [Oleiphilus sp. HI0130]KZZ73717.1 hypothetical protein